jgi:hypothetical protein
MACTAAPHIQQRGGTHWDLRVADVRKCSRLHKRRAVDAGSHAQFTHASIDAAGRPVPRMHAHEAAASPTLPANAWKLSAEYASVDLSVKSRMTCDRQRSTRPSGDDHTALAQARHTHIHTHAHTCTHTHTCAHTHTHPVRKRLLELNGEVAVQNVVDECLVRWLLVRPDRRSHGQR